MAAEEPHAVLGTAGRVTGTGGPGRDGVDVCESDVIAVKAVGLVDLGESRVLGIGKRYVDALEPD